MKGLQYFISLQDKVSAVAEKIGGRVSKLVGMMDRLTGVQDKVNGSAGRAAKGMDGMSGSLKRYLKLGTLAAGLNIASSFVAAGQQVIGVGKQFVDSALEMQGAERVINFVSGKEGAANLEFLYGTIDKLNLPLKDTRDSFANMTASFMGTTLEGKPMLDLFDALTLSATTLNLKGERLGRSFAAIGKMASVGTIQSDELRSEFGEAFPGAMAIASRAMGMTQQKFIKLVETGKVMSEDFLPKLAVELKKTFGAEAVKAAQSPQAMLTRLSNKFEELKIKIGTSVMPTVVKLAISLTEGLQKALPYVEKVMMWFDKMYNQISPYINAIRDNLMSAFASFEGSGALAILEGVVVLAAQIGGHISKIFALIAPYIGIIAENLSKMLAPLGVAVNAFLDLYAIVAPMMMQVLAWFTESADIGGTLGNVFTALSQVFNSVGRAIELWWWFMKPIVKLMAIVAGWLFRIAGEVIVWALQKITGFFDFLAEKWQGLKDILISFASILGLIDDKKVNVALNVQKKVEAVATPYGSDVGGLTPDFAKKTTSGVAPTGATGSADKINQGGSRPININIKYDAMNNGGITINSTTLKEGADQVQKLFEELFLRTLNGATQLAVK